MKNVVYHQTRVIDDYEGWNKHTLYAVESLYEVYEPELSKRSNSSFVIVFRRSFYREFNESREPKKKNWEDYNVYKIFSIQCSFSPVIFISLILQKPFKERHFSLPLNPLCHPDKDQKKDDDPLWLGYLAPESDVTVDCFPALLIPFSCSLPVHQAERKTWSRLPLRASGKFISGMFHLLTVWPYPRINNEPHTSQASFLKFLISQNPVYCLDKVSVLVLIPFMPLGMYQMVFISMSTSFKKYLALKKYYVYLRPQNLR